MVVSGHRSGEGSGEGYAEMSLEAFTVFGSGGTAAADDDNAAFEDVFGFRLELEFVHRGNNLALTEKMPAGVA